MEKFKLLPIMLFLSFAEGGSLMAFEILSAKIYTPYLGSSIYVWTAILTVTLIGLALGYSIGGKWTLGEIKKKLIYSFLIAGLLVVLSTFIAEGTLPSLIGMSVKGASIVAGFLILFVPVFFMGTISPLIIGTLNNAGKNLSWSTGIVFGTGTVGGIIFLLITVFSLIPSIGVQMTSFILGSILLICAGIVSLLNLSPNEQK